MRCDIVRDNMTALHDGELNPVLAWRIRRHATGCASRAMEVESIERLNSALLRADVVDHVPTHRAGRSFVSPRLAIVAAATAAVVVMAALIARQNTKPVPVGPTQSDSPAVIADRKVDHREPEKPIPTGGVKAPGMNPLPEGPPRFVE